ncbi:unnamed protein product [Peniophora sp. CBMAI 1063]|nr:unnamed protein product [Peniophora sp. CBMAI 1063]
MYSLQPESRSASPARSLSRGQACVACRQRKIKCDGQRPICGQCTKARRPQECHFEGVTRSRVQVLEESIQALEARIKELEEEGDNAGPSSVLLHAPHPPSSTSASSSPHSPVRYLGQQPVSSEVSSILRNVFFQNRSALPWFLHEGRIHQAFQLPIDDVGRPIAVLDTAMLLWGSVFYARTSQVPPPQEVEPQLLLSRAQSEVGRALVDASAQHIIQAIQAHALLAVYFCDTCLYIESRAHVDAAAALATRVGLHKIRGTPGRVPYGVFMDPVTTVLPEPLDAVEEGERINAFWTSFCLDRIYAVVLGVPPLIIDAEDADMQVDTPWPLDMTLYEQGHMPLTLQTSGTLRNFFGGVRSGWPWEAGMLSQLSRASALFECATRIAASWRPDLSNPTAYYARSLALDKRLDEFSAQLPALTPGIAVQLYLAHNLAHAGKIQLHSVFAQQNPDSRAKCLAAARAIASVAITADAQTFVFIDPALGSIWAAACRVLIHEVVAVRNNLLAPPVAGMNAEVALTADLDGLLAFMAALSATSESMNFQYSRIQQERLLLG